MHPAQGRAPYGLRIENRHVGGPPVGEVASAPDAEDLRRAGGEEPHGLLEAQHALFPHPVAEQVGGEAGVTELAGMGARVREAEHHALVLEQLGHCSFIGVGRRHPEARFEVGSKRQVEGQIHRVDPALVGHLGNASLVERRLLQAFDDEGVPPAAGDAPLVAPRPEGLAEVGVCVDPLPALEVRRRDRPEQRHALVGERGLELELDHQRAARDLGEDPRSLLLKLRARFEGPAFPIGSAHAGE